MSKRNNSLYEEYEHWCPKCKVLCDGFGELIPAKNEEHNGIHVVCNEKVLWRNKNMEFKEKEKTLSRGGKPHPIPPGRPDGAL